MLDRGFRSITHEFSRFKLSYQRSCDESILPNNRAMVEHEKTMFQSQRFNVVRLIHRIDDSTQIEKDVIRHPGAVVILPIVEPDRVCLIRNFRVSVNRHLIELPAGTLEAGEDPEKAAHRELIEETGYVADKIQPMRSFVVSPGILDEEMHLYAATGLRIGQPQREEGELIENLVVPWEEAIDMVRNEQISDAKSIIGLLSYELFHRSSQ